MPVYVSQFSNQDWAMAPLGYVFNTSPPRSLEEQSWTLTLSGVAIPNFKSGQSGSHWSYETITLPLSTDAPIAHVLGAHGIPIPQGKNARFQLDQWAPFASLNSIYDQQTSVDAGFAVDAWRPTLGTETDFASKREFGNIFEGLEVDLAARDSDAWIYRVGYNITLIGKIVFITPFPIP